MDDIARMPARDRADLFIETGTGAGMTTQIMEKDFWVCWTLKRLFNLPEPPAGLLFKGGTSLSKVFGLIQRFSEDVDLSFNRNELGFGGENDPVKMAANRRKKSLKSLAVKCREVVENLLLPQLNNSFGKALGTKDAWDLILDNSDLDGQTILFHYPRTGFFDEDYFRPIIRLEIGARSDHWPARDAIISPYAAIRHPKLFKEPTCNVRVLAAERTFWEKVTILHKWFNADAKKKFPDRQSRHYYDVVQMYQHELGKAAVKDLDLLQQVAKHQETFFQTAWARYKDAKPGTLHIVPPESRLTELQQDYQKMQSMIFGEIPNFNQLIDVLREIEQQVNNSSNPMIRADG